MLTPRARQAPDFSLSDQNGRTVSLSSFLAKKVGPFTVNPGKPVVLFFYPAAGTPGCTKEVCAFRDAFADFKAAGAAVYGISGDSVEAQAAFAEAQSLPYGLLSDEGDEVRSAYGVKPDLFGLLKGRETFVIDNEGILVSRFNDQLGVEKHVANALGALGSA